MSDCETTADGPTEAELVALRRDRPNTTQATCPVCMNHSGHVARGVRVREDGTVEDLWSCDHCRGRWWWDGEAEIDQHWRSSGNGGVSA